MTCSMSNEFPPSSTVEQARAPLEFSPVLQRGFAYS
jgi:hypothetical protein